MNNNNTLCCHGDVLVCKGTHLLQFNKNLKTFNNVYAIFIRGMARVDEQRHSYVAHALIILYCWVAPVLASLGVSPLSITDVL